MDSKTSPAVQQNDCVAFQDWEESDFCTTYEATWEISTEEIHYGWLAPGENSVGLLRDLALEKSEILDLGCGLGQNLIALAQKGASCTGVDISPCMLERAEALIAEHHLGEKIVLFEADMRDLASLALGEFDAVLSVYSMEYLGGVQELRTLIDAVHRHLKPGGVFILCFSHPSQAHRYPELMNCSVPLGAGKYRTYNYSIRDAATALFKCGFTIERVVEQVTLNPSQIRYEDGMKYPYHFRDGMNPCKSTFDEFSNGSPHTIIYKARRQFEVAPKKFDKQIAFDIGKRELWGVKRSINKHGAVSFLGFRFDAMFLAPRDNVIGVMDVHSFAVTERDVARESTDISVSTKTGEEYTLPAGSVLGLVHTRLASAGIFPLYEIHHVRGVEPTVAACERRLLLNGIDGLDALVISTFNSERIGLLVFVNGEEPARGELPVDVVRAKAGDVISLMYVVWGAKRKDARSTPPPIGDLFA